MEFGIIFSMMSVISSGIFHTASVAPTSASACHLRSRRCSCATFLDKECVYFCHLDIIWVNTPERAVSYGLGNAPRKKRSVRETSRIVELPRCECAHSTDGTCKYFCRRRDPQRVLRLSGCVGLRCRGLVAAGFRRSHKRAVSLFLRATNQI